MCDLNKLEKSELKRLQRQINIFYCYVCNVKIDVSANLRLILHYASLDDDDIVCNDCLNKLANIDLSKGGNNDK